ncbi:unnamed protein product [Cercospora beticola]|nr:unnamed protein product [Cercospora beticola]
MSKSLNILVSGAGIAAGVFTNCIRRAFPNNVRITMVERAPQLRLTGASVDIRNSAVDIIKWMGVEPAIRAHSTGEKGLSYVDAYGRPFATIATTGRSDVQSLTSEYEIFRGELAKILIEPVEKDIELVFDDHVKDYQQNDNGILVTFASGRCESYDLLVAADGMRSIIRGIMLGEDSNKHVHDEGVFAAYFTINKDLLEGSQVAKWRNMTGGRTILLRPDPSPTGRTRAHIITVIKKSDKARAERLRNAVRKGNESFMRLMEEWYRDGDWLTKDVLRGMRESDDFYCSPFAQVRTPKLADSRVVFIGDAGYSLPGFGTSLAIIGAYVLAGELLSHSGNIPRALTSYEEQMLRFTKPKLKDDGAMQVFNPQTKWGLAVRNTILRIVTRTGIDQLGMRAAVAVGIGDAPFPLHKYPWPNEQERER